jgi:hypothetical protein
MKVIILALLSAALAVCVEPAGADEVAAVAANDFVAFDASALHLNYREFFDTSSRIQDHQVGWAPGGSVQASGLRPIAPRTYLFGAARYDYFGGGVTQNSFTATGIQTTNYGSRLNMHDVDVEGGAGLLRGGDWLVTLYLESEYRDWIRVIDQAYVFKHENYQFWAPGVGAGFTHPITQKLSGTLKFGYAYMADNELHGTNSSNPLLSSEYMRLGDRSVWKVEGRLDYQVSRCVALNLSARLERFSDGRSANIYYDPSHPTLGIYEPFSVTTEVVAGAGAKWTFQ